MVPSLRDAVRRLWPTGARSDGPTLGERLFLERRLLNAVAYRRTKRAVRRRQSAERTRADVLDTVFAHEPGWGPYRVTALQYRDEVEEFVAYLEANEPETALEIGTFQGGTLWLWTRTLGTVRRIACIDKPVWNEMTHRRRRELFPMFAEDVRIDVLFGDSHADDTYQWAAAATGGDVDFLFIDGDHSYDGVREDFETYRRLVADGGCIAFHDIRRHAEDHREKETRLRRAESLPERYVSVGQQRWQGASTFWGEIRDDYTTREFLSHPEQMGAGIGVVEL